MPTNLRSGRSSAARGRDRRPGGNAPAEGSRTFLTHVGEHRIHAIDCGDSDRVLVLLHGLAGSGRWWSRNVDELCADWRVIVPDLIGFGRSTGLHPLPRSEAIAGIILDWASEIGIDRFSLAGHSMGGQVGIHITAAAPERIERLVLIDSSGIPRKLDPRALLRFAAEAAPLWRWGDPRFLPTIASDAASAGPRALLGAIRNILLDDVRPLLSTICVPTLIVWGERDTLVPLADAMELRRSIPGSRITVLRGAAHNPMVDRPADFNRILLRFLDGEPIGR